MKGSIWSRFPSSWVPVLMNLYPPFLGAGIRVRRLAPKAENEPAGWGTRMNLHWWSRNYVGTHYGGSLYSMCDPFYMLILFEALGRDHVVWDKEATIRFLRPGLGLVRAEFRVARTEIERIRSMAAADEKVEPVFEADVLGEDARVVARVQKRLYVRRKDRERRGRPGS